MPRYFNVLSHSYDHLGFISLDTAALFPLPFSLICAHCPADQSPLLVLHRDSLFKTLGTSSPFLPPIHSSLKFPNFVEIRVCSFACVFGVLLKNLLAQCVLKKGQALSMPRVIHGDVLRNKLTVTNYYWFFSSSGCLKNPHCSPPWQ